MSDRSTPKTGVRNAQPTTVVGVHPPPSLDVTAKSVTVTEPQSKPSQTIKSTLGGQSGVIKGVLFGQVENGQVQVVESVYYPDAPDDEPIQDHNFVRVQPFQVSDIKVKRRHAGRGRIRHRSPSKDQPSN